MDGLILPPGISLRPVVPDDAPFLFAVYAASRAEELAVVPWDDATRQAFLEQQFLAQDVAYRAAYPPDAFQLILRDEEPVGRLYLGDLPGELRVVDIALLPDARGAGIGSGVLRAILALAASSGRCVTLHVEAWNRAGRLYERLGFRVVDDGVPYRFMRWDPPLPVEAGVPVTPGAPAAEEARVGPRNTTVTS